MIVILLACGPDPVEPDSGAVDATSESGLGGEDLDGDGVTSGDDCDDADASVGGPAPEDCANGRDDDCDHYVDVGDPDCPFEVELDPHDLPALNLTATDAGLGEFSAYFGGDAGSEPSPVDGRPSFPYSDGKGIHWLDLTTVLTDAPADVASASYAADGSRGRTSTLWTMPDLDGDGQLDVFYRGSSGDQRLRHFGALPSHLDEDAALATYACGSWRGPDRDGAPGILGASRGSDDWLGLYWLDLSARGDVASCDGDNFPLLRLTDAEGAVDYGSFYVNDIDADGDGQDELLIAIPGTGLESPDWFYTGALWIVPVGFAGGETADEVATWSLDLGDTPMESGGNSLQEAISLGDVSGDGLEDLLVMVSTRFYVFFGPLSGRVGLEDADLVLPLEHSEYRPSNWSTFDLDGNGDLEVMFFSQDAGSRYVAFDDLTKATSWDDAFLSVDSSGGVLGAADFNGDGRDDVRFGNNILFGRPF